MRQRVLPCSATQDSKSIAAGEMGALPCDSQAKSRRIRFRGRQRYTAPLAAFTVLRGSR